MSQQHQPGDSNPVPNNPDGGLYHAGMRLPFFGGKGGAKILSKKDMNRLVKLLNAFANMQVLVKVSDDATNYGTLTISELNAVLEIAISATSGGSGPSVTDCSGHPMSCQEITFCDSGGNVKKMMVIGSAPYDP